MKKLSFLLESLNLPNSLPSVRLTESSGGRQDRIDNPQQVLPQIQPHELPNTCALPPRKRHFVLQILGWSYDQYECLRNVVSFAFDGGNTKNFSAQPLQSHQTDSDFGILLLIVECGVTDYKTCQLNTVPVEIYKPYIFTIFPYELV